MFIFRIFVLLFALILATPSFAARCGGDFNTFVASMSAEAASAGVSQSVVSQAFAGVTQDMAMLNFDRRRRHNSGNLEPQIIPSAGQAGFNHHALSANFTGNHGGKAFSNSRSCLLLAEVRNRDFCRFGDISRSL